MVGMRADVTLNVNTSKAKRSMDRAAAEINRSINGVSKKQISFNVNGKSFTQPLGRITASANEFTKSLEEAFIIVLFVSFLSLGLRAGAVVACSIPLVLTIVSIVMEFCHIDLQRISLINLHHIQQQPQ